MSSILNALKKLEANEAGEVPRGPQASRQTSSLSASFPGSKWDLKRWILYIVAAVFFAAGAAIYFNRPGAGGPSQTSAVVREVRSQLPPSRVAPAPDKNAPAAPTASGQIPRKKSEGQTPAGAIVKTAPSVQAPPPSSRIRPSEGGGAPLETRPPSTSKRVAPRDRSGASLPVSNRSPEDDLSRLEESKLRVMAIAWFEDPARRLAVVNGHIVKEGESVEGYSITKIRKDDIIVNDGSRSWRVELNLKSKS